MEQDVHQQNRWQKPLATIQILLGRRKIRNQTRSITRRLASREMSTDGINSIGNWDSKEEINLRNPTMQ